MIFSRLRYCLAALALMLLSTAAHATHIVGMDLFYTWVSGNTYKITLIAYGDCGSASSTSAFGLLSSATPSVCIFNGDTRIETINLSIEAPTAGVEITPVCPADISLTQCTSLSYTIPGIKKFVYSRNYTVSGTSTKWRFVFNGSMGSTAFAGRAGTITNIASGTVIQLTDTLNNTTYHNSSPALTVIPTPFFCLSNPNNYNPGAVDPNSDSLAFFLVPGRGLASTDSTCDTTAPITYTSPYTATAPLATSSFTFDGHTGQMSFTPNLLQRSLVVYNIEEYHGGQKVGTCQREMTFIVLTCTNTPATAALSSATNGTIDDSVHFHICQNTGDFAVALNPTEPVATNNITVTTSGLPSGCTVTTTGNGTPTPHVTLSWTSTGVTPGSYIIYVTYTDDNCPLSGTRTLAYTITILPAPSVTYSVISAATCLTNAAISFTPSGFGSPWHAAISTAAGDTIQTFPTVTSIVHDSLPSGSYTLTLFAASFYNNHCPASIPITIDYPSPFTIGVAHTSPTYCGLSDGTITISSLVPGAHDTVFYFYNGVLQPGVGVTVSAAGTIVLTGLDGGVYSGLYVVYGNCVSLPVPPFTLVNPPAVTPTATIIQPSYCGHHDGSITLYHMHPSFTDTVRFSYNGVMQPYQLHTVASDSIIVISGIYAGVYSDITVTHGNCTSPAIGPYTLTDPTPAVPVATFTNPSYCGHNDGTITISNLHAGDVDTIKYYLGGVLQPPYPATVSATGTIIISGLYSGTYTNITANFGPCVTVALGPFTLADPPLLVPTLAFVNPSYCGHNDGSITISNLHPGDLDTIKYRFNGVVQPPVILLVSGSGTVTLTGLGAGIYSSITATFASCVTTAAGPVTLAAPPLLVPAATASSPTYCGSTDGFITISNLHPGDADTIWYTLNGVVQPPKFLTVSASGIVVVTELVAGVYTNIYAQYGPCITDAVGPFTLTEPPFTMRAVSFTNPTKCGFCTGTMTFYGLHPGQTDSVHYFYNGVLQPAVVSTVSGDSTIVLTGLCEGDYSNIHVNFNANCVSGTFGTYTLVAPPIIPGFSYVLTKNCKGDTLVCTNTSSPAADLTYTWVFGDGATSTDTNPTHVYTAPGVYSVVLHITNTRCVDSIAQSITLNNLVKAIFTENPDSFACTGTPITFTNASLGSSLVYHWDFGDGTADSAANVVHIFSIPGTYTVVMTLSNNVPCTDVAKAVMSADPISDISLVVSDSILCVGQHESFTATYSPVGNVGVVWSFGAGDSLRNVNPAEHSYTATGHMVATVKALYRACPDTSASANLWVYEPPMVSLGPDTSICPGSDGILIADNINAANPAARWVWSTGQTTSSIVVSEPGTYFVRVSLYGCESGDDVEVLNDCYINIPNVFTPNGDGINDYFLPRELLARGLTSFRMDIYNRWGNLIFYTTNTDGRGWDGRYNDTPQPEGVYIYKIEAEFKDGQKESHKGNVTLLR